MEVLYNILLDLNINKLLLDIIFNPINIIFFLFMTQQFITELLSYSSKKDYSDRKSIIVSIGIFGTFLGIFIGLINFNTFDIKGSVPELLNGLKIAFFTSVMGMGYSVVLSVIQKGKRKIGDDSSEIETLQSIARGVDNLKKSFDEALKELSKSATEEIIEALNQVITDFNTNLKEQFGENFKQLNESVKNLLIWQENYKIHIEDVEEKIETLIQSQEKTEETIKNIQNSYEKTLGFNKGLSEVIDQINSQIKILEDYSNNLNQSITKQSDFFENYQVESDKVLKSTTDFSEKIRTSITSQSESISKLQDDLNKELPKSLNSLGSALTTLTNKFKEDYELFLKKIKELNDKLA